MKRFATMLGAAMALMMLSGCVVDGGYYGGGYGYGGGGYGRGTAYGGYRSYDNSYRGSYWRDRRDWRR
jgi:hypothetical protein